jgi:hypothetical protein
MGQLSNRQFGQNLAPPTMPVEPPDRSDGGHRNLCTCGCGAAVSAPRKFVNQQHYSSWLSRVRYFGRKAGSISVSQDGMARALASARPPLADGPADRS